MRGTIPRLALHVVLIAFSVLMVAPFFAMLLVSLVPQEAFLSRDFGLDQLTLDNYAETFRTVNVSPVPDPRRLITVPWKTWIRSLSPSLIFTCTRTVSPGLKSGILSFS